MTQDQLRNQRIIFDTVRKKWDEDSEKWYFSIVDIVSLVVKTSNPRNYWKVFKKRLNTKQNQLVTKCNQLKLESSDGKFYLTDVADVDAITEILKLISPKNSLPFKAWAMSISRPKEEKDIPSPTKKILSDLKMTSKEKSYPQVTYKLSNLIQKKLDINDEATESTEKKVIKKFTKITKMRTI